MAMNKSVYCVLGLLLLTLPGWAEETPPSALPACQAFAQDFISEISTDPKPQVTLFNQGVQEEKFEGKVGKQFVSTILSGGGIMQSANREPQGIQYTCLLENQDKAVFFHWTETLFANPLHTCLIKNSNGDTQSEGDTAQCLKNLYATHEAKRQKLEGQAMDWARHMESATPEKTIRQVMASRTEWETYRGSECAARVTADKGLRPKDYVLYDCMITKTRERLEDLGNYR